MRNVPFSVYIQLLFEVEPFKKSRDPRTITEQFDVNQQASAVGLYCF